MRARTLAIFVVFSTSLIAQTNFTRHEISVQGAYLRSGYFDSNTGGVTGRYTFNVRPELSFETAMTFHPANGSYGRSVTFFAGAKAGIRRQRWGFFGKASPGFRHFFGYPAFRTTPTVAPYFIPTTVGRTDFVMELGGALELYPTSRWFIRTDVSEILTRIGDHQQRINYIVTPIGPIYFGYEGARIPSSISVSAGIGYRFGKQEEQRKSTVGDFHLVEGGVHYALSNIGYDDGFEMMDNSGLGGWASYYLNRHIAIDGAATHFWDRTTIVAAQMGGDFWQVVVGPKIGITREKFGAYAKVRPGFVRFANSLNDEAALVNRGQFQPATQFAIDMGGVLEFYPKRHWVIRADFSDVTIHYGARRATYLLGPPFTWPSRTDSTIQTSFGFGWRF